MRTMGLDVGSVTVGIALSDPLKIIASSYDVLKYEVENTEMFDKIISIAKNNDVDLIVVGMPYLLNKDKSESCQRSQRFIDKLKAYNYCDVVSFDERFSTKSAEQTLIKFDVSRKKRKQIIDKLAATIILQNYLDTKK